MVTAEIAVAVPALVFVLTLGVSAVDLAIDHVRCVDAARVGARLMARGESEARVRADVARSAPDHASIALNRSGRDVSVTVRSDSPRLLALVGISAGPQAQAHGLAEDSSTSGSGQP